MKLYLKLFIGIIFLTIVGCNGYKSAQSALLSGDYDEALREARKYLIKHPQGKKAPAYWDILKEAYKGANERDLKEIDYLIKDHNPANLERIFGLYNDLNARQEFIKPLIKQGMQAYFPMRDYTDDILAVKKDLTSYLYDRSVMGLNDEKQNPMVYRKIYEDLEYIQKINPNYKDVSQLMQKAHFLGTVFVKVTTENQTGQIIPQRLEKDLLDFNSYGLDNFWTVYHTQTDPKVPYSVSMKLQFSNISITPEQIREREYIKEKSVKDGYKYLEKDGKLVKDSLGNAIKVDKYKTIQCRLVEYEQFKSARLTAKVIYTNLNTHQTIDAYPLESEFVFNHRYAMASGDRRALDTSWLELLEVGRVRFPSNEQMVFDAGEDLKNQLKRIIKRQKF